ncbi:MAG: FAD-binding oxidoreductase [Polyangia bacterium]
MPKGRDLRHSDEKVDISALNQIREIDPVGRTCIADSGVTFTDLVAATMRHGLIPIIVPELKTIPIGGAVSGCSIESRSFLHGGFHDTCLEYEVITSTGEVLTCRPDGPHSLLFKMMHSSFGTLGILSKLRFRLTPAKPYVKVTYEKDPTFREYVDAIQRHYSAQDIELMDGFIHSPSEYVLCAGQLVDEAPYNSQYDWVKVYYQTTRERNEDYLTTEDYLFRYDRGVTNVHPRSAVGRFFLGKLLGSSQLLWLAEKLHFLLDDRSPTVILDVFIPIARAEEFLDWYKRGVPALPAVVRALPSRARLRVDRRRLRAAHARRRVRRAVPRHRDLRDEAARRPELSQDHGRQAPGARRDQDADLAQLLHRRGVLDDLESGELLGGKSAGGSAQRIPGSVHQDLQGDAGAPGLSRRRSQRERE